VSAMRAPPQPERVALHEDADVAMARKQAREMAADQGLPRLAAEALATAVSEIARNVIAHAGAGEMSFEPAFDGEHAGVTVIARDDGPGIEDVARAFRDGYSTANSLGMGLSSARRLVDDFAIVSAVGTGTTVTMTKWARPRRRRDAIPVEDRLILLIEDDRGDEELLRRALHKQRVAGRVDIARDGVDALDYLFARGAHAGRDPAALPHLILLDLKLPKLQGLEVLRALRTDARTRLVPIVVLSSSNDEHDRSAAYEGGANSYVNKPVDFVELLDVVQQLGSYWLTLNQPPGMR